MILGATRCVPSYRTLAHNSVVRNGVAGAWLVKQHPRVRASLTTQTLPDEP